MKARLTFDVDIPEQEDPENAVALQALKTIGEGVARSLVKLGVPLTGATLALGDTPAPALSPETPAPVGWGGYL